MVYVGLLIDFGSVVNESLNGNSIQSGYQILNNEVNLLHKFNIIKH